MPTTLDYIPDGYTEAAFVRAVQHVHGDFRFVYRPMLVEERGPLLAVSATMKPDVFDQKCATEISRRLVSWSLTDAQGNTVQHSTPNVLRLKPKLFARVFAIVTGLEPSDADPEWKDSQQDEAATEQFESALRGRPVGDTRQEGDAKN